MPHESPTATAGVGNGHQTSVLSDQHPAVIQAAPLETCPSNYQASHIMDRTTWHGAASDDSWRNREEGPRAPCPTRVALANCPLPGHSRRPRGRTAQGRPAPSSLSTGLVLSSLPYCHAARRLYANSKKLTCLDEDRQLGCASGATAETRKKLGKRQEISTRKAGDSKKREPRETTKPRTRSLFF